MNPQNNTLRLLNQQYLVSRIANSEYGIVCLDAYQCQHYEEWTGKKKAASEAEDKPKGMFGSAMGSAKAMGSAMGNKLAEGASDLGVKAIAKMQELIDKALEHISGNKANQEFSVLWVPEESNIFHINIKVK